MKRKLRKVLSLLLSLAMLCSLAMPTAFAADSRYLDTTDHWAEAAINRWSDYNVIEGYGDAFNPDNAITRGQMATILSKTLGLTEEAENPFTDISADDWYAPYVLRCYKAGIMLGANGKAYPDNEISRQEAMTMFCRAFGIKADETADLTAFKDSEAIADWALPYVSALINGGIVSGVSSDMIAPNDSMSRAALVTILDRAVVQYINTSGEYDLTDKEGIILVTAGDTTLKGEAKADILITQETDGKSVTFKDATVTGAVTVQADTKIVNNNSKLPEIDATVEEVKKETPKKPSGGSSGGSSRPTISNLTISEEKAVTSGTYNNVTITDAVADGEVTLSGVTINGDLTIKGGGSSSIKLDACTIQGKVVMAKETGEAPRLELTNTPVATVEVQKPAIIEAVDNASAVTKIEATADIEIKGENTKIDTLAIPETAESAVAVTVTAGSVATVEAKAETSVTGASNSVNTIIATAAITADSEAVQKVEIPESATESVSVTVTGDAAVDVEINSTNGAAVTGANVTVSTTLETAPDNITVGGEAVTHIHKWGEPDTIPPECEVNGFKRYECIADGCDDSAKIKIEEIPKLGHNYGEWKEGEKGFHIRECANNKAHIEQLGHDWDEGKITTEANCGQDGVKTYTCPTCKATETETIKKLDHNWGDWEKVDDTNHKHTCSCTATETEEHKWDNGVITTEPTETTEGVKTYTCSECKGTKTEAVPAIPEENEPTSIYTFNEEKGLRIKWTEATLSEGQSYYVTIKEPSSQYNCTSASFPVGGFTSKDNVVSGKISITVDVGTGWKETSALYEEKEIANITVNSTVPQFTIEKDDNGAYNFVSDANGGLWVYQVYNEEGLLTYSGNAINGAIDSYANFESGCKVVARYMTWSLSDDKDYAEITLTQQAEYTYNESTASDVTITLVQEGDSIKATWTGTDLPNYYFEIEDSNGKYVTSGWTNGDECYTADLSLWLPRADADSSYSLVVYSADENYNVVEEIARLRNCFDITVSGDSVEYDIAFNDSEDGVHSVTLTGDTLPGGIRLLDAWYDSTGKQRGTGTSSISKNKTEHKAIQNGYSYDLRVLTAYALEGQTIKATMTPPSKKTYINENEPKIKWSAGGAIAWQAVANADDYKLNIYSGSVVDEAKLVASKNTGTYSTVYYIDSNFDLAKLAENKDTAFTVELLALDTNDNVIETVGVLAEGINLTFTETAPTYSFEVTGEKTYTITFAEGTPDGMRYIEWFDTEGNSSGGRIGFGMTALTSSEERAYAFADGDTIKVYITTLDTVTDTVWTITRTPDAIQTYTTEETDASLLSFRKWNTDIMFDGYDDVGDTKSLEVNGVKVVSGKTETMSEFLFDYDQTKGNITDADFVVELDGVEKERISKNVDVTLSNKDVAFTINTDGTLSFDATTHGSFAYKTTKGGSGRIAFKNGTLVDGWTLPTLTDGETIDIMHIDCTYDETTKSISATISKHTTKTYTENSDSETESNAHLMMEGDYLYLVFEDEEGLGANEWYYVLQNGEDITSENLKEIELTWLLPGISQNTVLSYEIQKGTWQTKETFVKFDNAINVTVTDSAPNLSLVPQADGTYKITGGGDTGYFYRVTTPEGDRLATDYTLDDTFLCSIYEGCTVELQTGTITVAEDGLSANITMSPVVKIENPTLPTGLNTVVEVDTADELLDAVNRGAIATLTADITSENVFKFKTGAPATIDLNGHVLTAPTVRAYYGKELTIDATKAGSAINATLTTNLKGSFILNGGTYDRIRLSGGKKFIANAITIQSSGAYNPLETGMMDYVEISNSSCISTSNADLTSGLYIWNCKEVVLNNVVASAESNWFGADIAWCGKVNIAGGSFSAVNNDGLRFVECESATVDGASVSGSTAALLVQDGAVAQINGGTFTSAGNSVIQLSREDSALTINNGTFIANGDGSIKNIVIMEDTNTFIINGGTFEGFSGVTYSDTATASINGGTFSFDPTEYVDTATHTVTDNGDGTYVVTAIKTE